MTNTVRISFSIRNAYKVNSILYSLKQLPFLGRRLPERWYGIGGVKRLANVIAAVWEVASALLGKLLYFLVMIRAASGMYGDGVPSDALFLHMLFFLSMLGALLNTYLFNPTKDKYYAIILMRMNARESALADYGYALLKLVIGFGLFGTLFGMLAGVPLWICLLAPFFVVGLKMTVAMFTLMGYERTGDATSENAWDRWIWAAIAALLAAAYGLPALGLCLPVGATVALMCAPIVTGAVAARRIWAFPHYRAYYQQILRPATEQRAQAARIGRATNDRQISTDATITSKRTGFEYLNELFVKRHRRMLWKASRRLAWIAAVAVAALLVGFLLLPDLAEGLNRYLMTSLPWFVFVMYSINRGPGFTQMLFVNCDHGLLTYSFYKQPRYVLALFRIRLREIIKVNLLPACVLGPGLALLLYASGGTDDAINYAVLAVTMPALSVFFSVHHLMLYYLLQPYNAGTEIKSATYQVAQTATYLVCFFLMRVNIPTPLFGALAIAFCALYSVVACAVVYRYAPKTFRLRA